MGKVKRKEEGEDRRGKEEVGSARTKEKEKACRENGLSHEEGVRPGCGLPCGADGSGKDSTPLSQAVCPAPVRYATATPSASSSKSCEAARSRARYLGAWLLPGEDGGR